MNIKSYKLNNILNKEVYLKNLLRLPLLQFMKSSHINNTDKDYFKILESFNHFISNNNSKFELKNTLKKFIVDYLGFDCCAWCTKNDELEAIEVNLVTLNNKSINYIIPYYAANKDFLNLFNQQKSLKKCKNIASYLNYPLDEAIKYIHCIPLKQDNNNNTIVCIGSSNSNKKLESVLKIIVQQISLIYTNNKLFNQLKQENNDNHSSILLNHENFQQQLTVELDKLKNSEKQLTLMLMDFPGLIESVFDESTLISGILKEHINKIGIAGRISKTTYAAILNNIGIYQTQLVAKCFTEDITRSFINDSNDIIVNIGIASYPTNAIDKEELLFKADNALTLAKEKSKIYNTSHIINANYLNHSKKNDKQSVLVNVEKTDFAKKFADELIQQLNAMDSNNYNMAVLSEIISSLAAAIDAKDSYIINHSQAVSQYAEIICNEIGLNQQETEKVRLGALMHDIGKIGIPEYVLGKPSKLDEKEWEIIRQHPTIGARRIIQPISALNDLIPVVEHHHESWDGSGYPYGLKKEEIPLGARIVSIADAFHTITTDRPYRKAMGYDKAVKILQKGSGTQWDSSLIQSFLKISHKAHAIVQNNSTI